MLYIIECHVSLSHCRQLYFRCCVVFIFFFGICSLSQLSSKSRVRIAFSASYSCHPAFGRSAFVLRFSRSRVDEPTRETEMQCVWGNGA